MNRRLVLTLLFLAVFGFSAEAELSFSKIGGEAALVGQVGEETATALTVPEDFAGCPVTSIGDGAFENCGALGYVSLPTGLRAIGRQAFGSCTGLVSITIPQGVTNIACDAFKGCGALTNMTFLGNAPSLDDGLTIHDGFCGGSNMVIRVTNDSRGWDGDPDSTVLPAKWPTTGENVHGITRFNLRTTRIGTVTLGDDVYTS